MKNRSTRKNKTRNFRKKNKGGTKGKKPTTTTMSMSNMIKNASNTSSHTARPVVNLTHMSYTSRPIGAGDENKVFKAGFWDENWTKLLKQVISPELFKYMTVEKDTIESEKNLLLYHIYWKAHKLVYPFPGLDMDSKKKDAIEKIIELIDEFIDDYANGYTGEKLKPEYR